MGERAGACGAKRGVVRFSRPAFEGVGECTRPLGASPLQTPLLGMPARNNTTRPRSNSFRRFCTTETCQYVNYCLRCVAARQSSRHLAYMQGARIKACGSFPPQIVLALTSSKNSRRGSRAAPLCGDPDAKHPSKISCPEARFHHLFRIIRHFIVQFFSVLFSRKSLANM